MPSFKNSSVFKQIVYHMENKLFNILEKMFNGSWTKQENH